MPDALDGVGEGELLIVVAVHSDSFAGHVTLEEFYNVFDLFAEEVAKAVYDIDCFDGCFGELLECFDQVEFVLS